MRPVKMFDDKDMPMHWEYDGQADVHYISFGELRAATGVDVGEGIILRYDEAQKELVGLIIVGVGRRLEEFVKSASSA